MRDFGLTARTAIEKFEGENGVKPCTLIVGSTTYDAWMRYCRRNSSGPTYGQTDFMGCQIILASHDSPTMLLPVASSLAFLKDRATCRTCRWWGSDESRPESETMKVCYCPSNKKGYNVREGDVPDTGIHLEDDEWWGMETKPGFSCINHELKTKPFTQQ